MAPPRKLLFFIGDFAGGGTQGYLLRLLEGVDRARFEPTVACFVAGGELHPRISALAPIVAFPLRGRLFDPHGLRTLLRFARWLRSEHVDVVNTLSDRANVFGLIGAALARMTAVVASQRGLHPRHDSFVTARPALIRLSHLLFRRIPDFITVNNPAIADHLVNRVRVPPDRVRVIDNGVDTERFAPRPADPSLSDRLGIPAGRQVIGIVGRVVPSKGHSLLLDVLERYPSPSRPFLLSLGDGPFRRELEGQLDRRGLSESVRFAGFVPDPSRFYNLLDVFCLPTASEGTPTALIEAMASGVPVVVSDLPQLRRIVRHEETALFVDASSADTIRAALERLRTEPALQEKLRSRSRMLAVERHGVRTMVERTENLYEEALAGKSR